MKLNNFAVKGMSSPDITRSIINNRHIDLSSLFLVDMTSPLAVPIIVYRHKKSLCLKGILFLELSGTKYLSNKRARCRFFFSKSKHGSSHVENTYKVATHSSSSPYISVLEKHSCILWLYMHMLILIVSCDGSRS